MLMYMWRQRGIRGCNQSSFQSISQSSIVTEWTLRTCSDSFKQRSFKQDCDVLILMENLVKITRFSVVIV